MLYILELKDVQNHHHHHHFLWFKWLFVDAQVESDSGWMMTKSAVDHLQGTVLSFFVKATDCGSPPKHSLVSAFIHVVPADAFVPSFSQPQYSFTIPEDTAVGTALGSVYLGPEQMGFFTEIGGETLDSNQDRTFLVEKETGLIRLLKPLDYEEVSIFRFKVAATTRRDLIESISTVDLEVKVCDSWKSFQPSFKS